MNIYDGAGQQVVIGGEGSSFEVADLDIFNVNGQSYRQGTLTYEGKRFYPKNYREQRLDVLKKYTKGIMLTLGDSYTYKGKKEFDAFAAEHGLIQDNQGVSSSTIAGTPGANAQPGEVGYQPFWWRLDAIVAEYKAGKVIDGTTYHAEDVKLILFMGGTNDWYVVKPDEGIDRLGDFQSTNKEQLYGATKYCFETFSREFPNADKIVILQPASGNDHIGTWLKEGVVKECAEMFGLPICDCIFDWYSPTNPGDLTKYWQDDKLHLTSDGYTALLNKVGKTLDTLNIYR